MRAAVLAEYGEPLEVRDVPRPTADDDSIVVEPEACGVCRSDWHAWQGHGDWIGDKPPTGQILGHEPAGTVVEVGSNVENFQEGDRVSIPFNLGDGTCPRCQQGHSNVCDNIRPLGFTEEAQGAFAEAVEVPAADFNAAHLPEGVSAVDMASLGCRFMSAFHGLAHRADVTPGDWVAIHGCGGVGLSAVQIANALSANVVAVDIQAEKLQQAKDFGADVVVDGSEGAVPDEVHDITDGGAQVSVDALGIAETARNSVKSLGTLGQHVQIGLTTSEEQGMVTLPTDEMVVKEVDFLGSHGMPPSHYDEIFRMIAAGDVDPGRLTSETISLAEVSQTLEAMTDYETVGIPVVTEFA